jgi:hypothetical protein
MAERTLTAEEIRSMLQVGPHRIAAATAGLTEAELQASPGPDQWSLNEILAHLRSCGDMWGQAIEAILASDRPTIRAVNPWTWLKRTNYLELDFRPSFEAFAAQRAQLLAVLEPLTPGQWQRSAMVTGAGKPLERTAHFYAQWLATHERSHLKHIERLTKSLRG